jgi:hypothetical protein
MMLPSSIRVWTDRAAVAAALAGPIYYAGAFVYIAVARIGYPFSLEWLEGGSFAQVQRILSGQLLYARPSLEYAAMIYPPFYYYVAAAAARLLGFSFLPLRLVSIASSLGCMVLIYWICTHEGAGKLPALLGAGLFAASFRLCGGWFDIARVDMLSIFLVLLALLLLRLPARGASLAAGVVFALACLTKQTHLITLASVSIYLLAMDRPRAVRFLVASMGALSAAYFILDRHFEGWFGFFVLRLAVGSGEYVSLTRTTILQTAAEFWLKAVVLALPVATLLIAVYGAMGLRSKRERERVLFFLSCAVGMLGTSWSVVQLGGFKNDLVPAYAIIAVLFGLSVHELSQWRSAGPRVRAAVLAGCALQFGLLIYPVSSQIPTTADRRAGEALVRTIREQPGAVYVPFHPELALMADKSPYASWSPLFQLEGNYGGGDVRAMARVKTEFSHAMARHEFSMIILDQQANWIWGNPESHYTASLEPVFSDPAVFWPVTGWQTRPETEMLPNAE